MLSRTKPSQIAKGSKNQRRSNQSFAIVPRPNRRGGLICLCTLMVLILSLITVACTDTSKSYAPPVTESSTQSTALKLWWDKGFTLEEDEALQQLVSRWEQQSGNKIKLSFYATDELPRKIQRAIQAGSLPDIVMSYTAERELNPRLGWEGKLADVSDVIEPVKSLYPKTILETVRFYNNVDKKLSYYAVPINQATIHIFYWRDLLQQVGRSPKDIPKDWDAFWEFWKQLQDDLHTQKKLNIYGLGFPFSISSADTFYLFEQILEAYDVQILDSKGQLLVNAPKVHQGLVKCLEWYAKFYQQGYVPPDAVNWLNPDNNRQLLNRELVMTPNNSLSIPAAIRQDHDIYYNKLGILEFPNKPSGKPMRYLITVKQVVLFAESKNQKAAKDFLAYLVKPKVMGDYLKASGSRHLPVIMPVWKDPFWTDPANPYLSSAAKILLEGQIRSFNYVQNPSYSRVLKEKVWGKAIHKIVVNGISPEQAAAEAIEQIKQIFDQW